MARSIERVADRLFATVMAPLVIGGPMRPGAPIGARDALALLESHARPSDVDLASRVDLQRVRALRRIAPIDRVTDPTGAEWALGAALHDVLQATSPRWLMRSSARRLLELATHVLEKVPRVATAREALMRHGWTARVLEVARNDTRVTWWTGEREFFGEPPPPRLLAWPDLRRVHVARARRPIAELANGTPDDRAAFDRALSLVLRASPLTDLATCGRASPAFAWTEETIAIVRVPAARELALRAVAIAPSSDAVDTSLGRATRALLASRAWAPATIALDVLAHRAVAAAHAGAPPIVGDDAASFARAAGAMVARRWLDDPSRAFADLDRRRLASALDAASRGSVATEVASLLATSARSS